VINEQSYGGLFIYGASSVLGYKAVENQLGLFLFLRFKIGLILARKVCGELCYTGKAHAQYGIDKFSRSAAVILLTRKFGRRLVESLYPAEKIDALPILNEPKKRNAATAILFLIPGTPKDLLTYLVGLTKMSIPQYLVITLVCRFPSVIMSTLSGDALGDDRLIKALWLFVITAIVSACGYLLYLFLQKRQKRK
jgi:hypothetical protein